MASPILSRQGPGADQLASLAQRQSDLANQRYHQVVAAARNEFLIDSQPVGPRQLRKVKFGEYEYDGPVLPELEAAVEPRSTERIYIEKAHQMFRSNAKTLEGNILYIIAEAQAWAFIRYYHSVAGTTGRDDWDSMFASLRTDPRRSVVPCMLITFFTSPNSNLSADFPLPVPSTSHPSSIVWNSAAEGNDRFGALAARLATGSTNPPSVSLARQCSVSAFRSSTLLFLLSDPSILLLSLHSSFHPSPVLSLLTFREGNEAGGSFPFPPPGELGVRCAYTLQSSFNSIQLFSCQLHTNSWYTPHDTKTWRTNHKRRRDGQSSGAFSSSWFDKIHSSSFSCCSKYQTTILAYLVNTGDTLGTILPSEDTTASATNSTSTSFNSTSSSTSDSTSSFQNSTSSTNSTEMATETESTAGMQASRLFKRQSEPLLDYAGDLLWAGKVTVGSGNPSQDFVVMFDTGSSDFFVPSTYCTSRPCSGVKYDSTLSAASQQQKGSFSITYGDGSSTSGPIFTDTITIGSFSAPNQWFSAVTQLSDSFSTEPEDGIMGMAYPSISNIKAKHTIAASAKMFGFHLEKVGEVVLFAATARKLNFSLFEQPSMGSSELFLGGTNPSRYTGDIEWHPNQKQAYYNISMQPWIKNSLAFPGQVARNAIIDTGTTVIIAPPGDAANFWAQVPGSTKLRATSDGRSYYAFPCSSPPAISFSFENGKIWKISAADLNLGRVAAGSDQCVGAVTGGDVGLGSTTWILGCSFLKNVYSVFDRSADRVGFAVPVPRK
ncbi:hypothetical protein P7C70_g4267, partial [Phenoliferia sp. Uapishka_3]